MVQQLSIVRNLDSLAAVGTLRHASYSAVGALPQGAAFPFLDHFDQEPQCANFGLHQDDRLVAAIRANEYSADFGWRSVAAHLAFQDSIEHSLGRATPFVESNRFVVSPDLKAFDPRILFCLFRSIGIAAIAAEVPYVLTAVRPEHIPLYTKWLGFRAISHERTYPGLTAQMCLLMREAGAQLHNDLNSRSATAISFEEIEIYREQRAAWLSL
jgi:hypothetical protein